MGIEQDVIKRVVKQAENHKKANRWTEAAAAASVLTSLRTYFTQRRKKMASQETKEDRDDVEDQDGVKYRALELRVQNPSNEKTVEDFRLSLQHQLEQFVNFAASYGCVVTVDRVPATPGVLDGKFISVSDVRHARGNYQE